MRRLHYKTKKRGLDIVMAVALEALMALMPMAAASVVLYDIAVRGLGSPFTLLLGGVALVWLVMWGVSRSMSRLDNWVDTIAARGSRRNGTR